MNYDRTKQLKVREKILYLYISQTIKKKLMSFLLAQHCRKYLQEFPFILSYINHQLHQRHLQKSRPLNRHPPTIISQPILHPSDISCPEPPRDQTPRQDAPAAALCSGRHFKPHKQISGVQMDGRYLTLDLDLLCYYME